MTARHVSAVWSELLHASVQHHRLRNPIRPFETMTHRSNNTTHDDDDRMEKVNVLSGEIQRTWVWQGKVRRQIGRRMLASIHLHQHRQTCPSTNDTTTTTKLE